MLHLLFVVLFTALMRTNYYVVKYSRAIKWGFIQRKNRVARFFKGIYYRYICEYQQAFSYIVLSELYHYLLPRTKKELVYIRTGKSWENTTFYIGNTWFMIQQSVFDETGDCGYQLFNSAGTFNWGADDNIANKTIMSLYYQFSNTLAMNEEAQTLINRMPDDQLARNHYSRNNMGFAWHVWSYYYAALTAYRKVICKKTIKDIQEYNDAVKPIESCDCEFCRERRGEIPPQEHMTQEELQKAIDNYVPSIQGEAKPDFTYVPLDYVLAELISKGVLTVAPSGTEPMLSKNMTEAEKALCQAINETLEFQPLQDLSA